MVRSRDRRFLVALAVGFAACVCLLVPSESWAQDTTVPPAATSGGFRPRPVRQGTVSLEGGGQYGLLLSKSGLGELFDHGPGILVRLRYRTDAAAAFGVSFEAQHFDAREPAVADTDAVQLQIIVTTLDYYQFYRTRSRTPWYWVAGAGLAQTRRKDKDDERRFPGEGGAFTVGAGTEYWLKRTLTADLSVRYYGVLISSKLNHTVQVGVGLNFYTSP